MHSDVRILAGKLTVVLRLVFNWDANTKSNTPVWSSFLLCRKLERKDSAAS